MRAIVAHCHLTLDGVMQAPGTPEEDPTGGFRFGGWSVPYFDESMGRITADIASAGGDLLLGRKTYEIFAAHWPFVGEGDPIGTAFDRATKYVVSNTITEGPWNPTVVLAGDAATEVTRLRATDGPDLHIHGSTELLQALLAADLIDELRLLVFPVVIGTGKRLFGTGTRPAAMALVSLDHSRSGVLMATYRRAGDIELGSFGLEQPTELEMERRANLGD